MRLKLAAEAKQDNVIHAGVTLEYDDDEPEWEMGELTFTMDEWTKFVKEAALTGTTIGFDILTSDAEKVIL